MPFRHAYHIINAYVQKYIRESYFIFSLEISAIVRVRFSLVVLSPSRTIKTTFKLRVYRSIDEEATFWKLAFEPVVSNTIIPSKSGGEELRIPAVKRGSTQRSLPHTRTRVLVLVSSIISHPYNGRAGQSLLINSRY